MHPRGSSELIPIYLYRTLAAIVDTGSITKAGESLRLTQAAISAHIKKLESMLGGAVFERSGAGTKLTGRGQVILEYSRRFLAMNDQMLASVGLHPQGRPFSIGLPPWLGRAKVIELFKTFAGGINGQSIVFRCDKLNAHLLDLGAGSLDLAFLCETTEPPIRPLVQWQESLCWVAAPGFTLAPDAPIPLISWPGILTDRVAVKAFEATGVKFTIPFSSPDAGLRSAAVEAGLGYTIVNMRSVTPSLRIVHEHFLPPAPTVKSGIYTRPGLDLKRHQAMISAFQKAMDPAAMMRPAAETPIMTKLARPCQQMVVPPASAGHTGANGHDKKVL